jgi:histidine triad (HIT) family protein
MIMNYDDNCIFCKIIKGTIPSFNVYEDDHILAILDLRSIQPGHTLVIPKIHINHFMDVPDDLSAHIIHVGQKIARKMRDVLKPERVGNIIAGYGVAHVHYHVIPMNDPHDITSRAYAYVEGDRVIFDAEHATLSPVEDRDKMSKLLWIPT